MKTGLLLTKSSTFLIGWIASLLGLVMMGIFNLLDWMHIPNIGLTIILYTIVVYMLMLPLTYKQQKFSTLSNKMNPELQKIQAKYKGKTDQQSQMAMNSETQAVYAKYGVNPMGSCLQLIVQMPLLFGLYQVIYRIPAYVHKIGDVFGTLADYVESHALVDAVKALPTASAYLKNFEKSVHNGIIDVFYNMNSTDLVNFATEHGFVHLQYGGQNILSQGGTRGLIDTYNNFLGLNIANSPWSVIKTNWASFMAARSAGTPSAGYMWLLIGALVIPILAGVTQWANTKIMPQPEQDPNQAQSTMGSSMKMMNTMMPLMSVFFCFTLPSGMGLYWIAGAVVRTIQQLVLNKHFEKMDFDAIIEANKGKAAKKKAKNEANTAKLQELASMNTRNIDGVATSKKYTQKASAAAQKLLDMQKQQESAQSKPASGSKTVNLSKSPAGSKPDAATSAPKQSSDAAGTKASSRSSRNQPSSGRSLFDKANSVQDYNSRNNKK